MMKGNEKDCICEKSSGKHRRNCDAYRLSEFFIKASAVMPNPIEPIKDWRERIAQYVERNNLMDEDASYFTKLIDEALSHSRQQLLKEIREGLPKEKKLSGHGAGWEEDLEPNGYNLCLREIKSLLNKIEHE